MKTVINYTEQQKQEFARIHRHGMQNINITTTRFKESILDLTVNGSIGNHTENANCRINTAILQIMWVLRQV